MNTQAIIHMAKSKKFLEISLLGETKMQNLKKMQIFIVSLN